MTLTQTGSTDIGGYPTPAASVAQLFYDRVAATPTAEAFRFPARDGWTSVSWAGAAETVKTLAAGLLSLGIQPEQRVAIASNTRIEWLYADLAVMCAGAATTAVYPSTTADDVLFILADSETRIVFAEDDAQIEKLWQNASTSPTWSRWSPSTGRRTASGCSASPISRPAEPDTWSSTRPRSTTPSRRWGPSTWRR